MDGLYIMENPIQMDDLGGKPTILRNIHINLSSFSYHFNICKNSTSQPAVTNICWVSQADLNQGVMASTSDFFRTQKWDPRVVVSIVDVHPFFPSMFFWRLAKY